MSTARQVCDGWDAPVTTTAGDRVTLHFRAEPTAQQIAEALAAYEVSQVTPEPEYTIECEDGTYA